MVICGKALSNESYHQTKVIVALKRGVHSKMSLPGCGKSPARGSVVLMFFCAGIHRLTMVGGGSLRMSCRLTGSN